MLVPELKATGRVQPYEKEFFRKDGGRVPVLSGAATFEGDAYQGVAFVLDLTERNGAADAMREVQTELAHANRLATMGPDGGRSDMTRGFSSALYRVAERARVHADMPDLYTGIHSALRELMGAKSFHVVLRDEASGALTLASGDQTAAPDPDAAGTSGVSPAGRQPRSASFLASLGEIPGQGLETSMTIPTEWAVF
jgi:hypothetical protein